MATNPMVLGPVTFEDFEIPSKVNLGGAQRIVTHTLSDGRRIVDTLGPDDSDVRFSGTLSGRSAVQRALMLDAMRASGQSVTLSWETLVYSVVIRRFSANFESPFWIPYEITCLKLAGASGAVGGSNQGLQDIVSSSLLAIAGVGAITGLAISDAEQALDQPNATVRSTAAYNRAVNQISVVVASCQELALTADQDFITAADNPITDLVSGRASLAAATGGSYRLWQLTAAGSYWTNIGKNLQYAST